MPDHKNIHEAMAAAFAEMPAVEPDAQNTHFKSKYTTLGAIIAAVRPVLARHGLFVVQDLSSQDDAEGNLTGRIDVSTMLYHRSGACITVGPCAVPMTKADAHGAGSAITYARRYALSAALCVTDVEDDFGNAAAHGGAENGQPVRREVPQQVNGKALFAQVVARATGHTGTALGDACRAACLAVGIDSDTQDPADWNRAIKAVEDGRVEFKPKNGDNE